MAAIYLRRSRVTKNYKKKKYMYYTSSFYSTKKWHRIRNMFIVSGISFAGGALLVLQLVAHAMGIV